MTDRKKESATNEIALATVESNKSSQPVSQEALLPLLVVRSFTYCRFQRCYRDLSFAGFGCVLMWLVFAASPVVAGGISIDRAEINQLDADPTASALRLCFSATYYQYSGSNNEAAFIVFVLKRKDHPEEVFYKREEPVSPAQLQVALRRCVVLETSFGFDGTPVDLYYYHAPVFVPASSPSPPFLIRLGLSPRDFGQTRNLPCEATACSNRKAFPLSEELARGHKSLRAWDKGSHLLTFQIQSPSVAAMQPEVYLKLDGGIPEQETKITPGVRGHPVVYSFSVRPAKVKPQFSYRLYPLEREWTSWAFEENAEYQHIPAGVYLFQVKARIAETETNPATHSFVIDADFVSPAIKGNGTPSPNTPVNSYARRRALLLGIPRVAKGPLSQKPLDFVASDLVAMESALTAKTLNFEVKSHIGPLTRQDMLKNIEEFLDASVEQSADVVYISSHGVASEDDNSESYIVSYDCDTAAPMSTCVSISQLKQHVLAISEKRHLRHVLIVLDACASGIGAQTKGGAFFERSVANKSGVHILAAGTGSQDARQATEAPRLSVFTKSLVSGLSGSADYTHDGTITLSELLVYTRYNVSVETDGRQTPSMGNLAGVGEMVFLVEK